MRRLNKETTNKLIIFFVYFIYLCPDYFNQFVISDVMVRILQVVLFLFIIVDVVTRRGTSKFAVWVGIYLIIPILPTIFCAGKLFSALAAMVKVLGIVLWTERFGRRYPHNVLPAVTRLMEVLIYINFLTIIFFPHGLYTYETEIGWKSNNVWFFGLRNVHAPYLVLGCFCEVLRYQFCHKTASDKFRVILMHTISLITIIKLASGGGYVMMTAYALLLIFSKIFQNFKIDFSVAIIFHVVLFFSITLLSATLLFAGFFALFGKEGTATGRITVWATMWKHIIERPIFGHGYMQSEDMRWLMRVAAGATTGHNAMIDMMFRGGIVTYVSFVMLLFEVKKRVEAVSQHREIYNFASISFMCMFLLLQSEGGMESTVLFALLGFIAILPQMAYGSGLEANAESP